MTFFIFLFLSSLFFINDGQTLNTNINKNVLNNSEIAHYDYLFDSREYDFFNLRLIYNKNHINDSMINTIKIKHKKNSYSKYKETCVFGVLCNDKGLEIEKEMLSWLLQEYDVYCIYQKYPGILYEYPALRFAQWISEMYNKDIILYVHTKGAFHPSIIQIVVREIWKHEFTNPRKKIYIKLLQDNYSDISLPFRSGIATWFNGMFISNRAFKLIEEIKSSPKTRWYYESLFQSSTKSYKNIRFKGVLNDSISALLVPTESYKINIKIMHKK